MKRILFSILILLPVLATSQETKIEFPKWYYSVEDSLFVDSLVKKYNTLDQNLKIKFVKNFYDIDSNRGKVEKYISYFIARVFINEVSENLRLELIKLYQSQHCETQHDGFSHIMFFLYYPDVEKLTFNQLINQFLLVSLSMPDLHKHYHDYEKEYIKKLVNRIQSLSGQKYPCYYFPD